MHAPRKDTIVDRIMRCRYFFFALLLHLIVFAMVSTVIIFKAVIAQADIESGLIAGPAAAGDNTPPPPPPPPSESVPVQTNPTSSDKEIFAIDNPSQEAPNIPIPVISAPSPTISKNVTTTAGMTGGVKDSFGTRASGIRQMVSGWGRSTGNSKTFGGNGRNTAAVFKCYIARYAQGDWETTIELRDEKVFRGSLVNLLYEVSQRSRGRIKADVVAEPLRLDSSEIFDVKPPFIYFTGHKNFVLTQQEVDNLRKYLIQGGCIWGDNGLAGRGSRFDVAFRREMKRVLPSEDQQFVVLPDSHPIFTQSYLPINGVPPGMNYYQEPIEAINMDGTIAVVYTLNDYSDMFQMAFKPGTIEMAPDENNEKSRITESERRLWAYHDVYYRNFTPEACSASFDLGLNIIVHLLTRWDEKLLLQ